MAREDYLDNDDDEENDPLSRYVSFAPDPDLEGWGTYTDKKGKTLYAPADEFTSRLPNIGKAALPKTLDGGGGSPEVEKALGSWLGKPGDPAAKFLAKHFSYDPAGGKLEDAAGDYISTLQADYPQEWAALERGDLKPLEGALGGKAAAKDPDMMTREEAGAVTGPTGGASSLPTGLVPTGESQTTQGSKTNQTTRSGQLPDEMVRSQTAALEQTTRDQAQSEYDAATTLAAMKSSRAGNMESLARDQERAAAAATVQAEQRIARARAKTDEILAEPVGDTRSFGTKLLGGIAIFLGGISGALLGRDNEALKIIERGVDQSIAAQIKKRDANIQRWERELGSAEAAKAAAELKAWQGVKTRFEAAMVDEDAQEVLERGRVGIQLAETKIAEASGKLAREAYGTLTTSEQSTSATSATSEQQRPKPTDPGQLLDMMKKQLELQNAQLDQADAAKISQVVGQNVSPQQAEKIRAGAKTIAAGEAELSGAKEMTANLAKKLGAQVNTTTGEITWPDDLSGAGFWGTIKGKAIDDATLGFAQTDYKSVQDAQRALGQYVTSQMTGANSSIKQDQVFTTMVGGDLTNEEQTKQNLTAWARTLWSKSEALKSSDPLAARFFESSLGGQRTRALSSGAKEF